MLFAVTICLSFMNVIRTALQRSLLCWNEFYCQKLCAINWYRIWQAGPAVGQAQSFNASCEYFGKSPPGIKVDLFPCRIFITRTSIFWYGVCELCRILRSKRTSFCLEAGMGRIANFSDFTVGRTWRTSHAATYNGVLRR